MLKIPVSSRPHQHLLLHPIGCEVASGCGLICIVMIGGAEHVFMYLRVICIFPLEKYLFTSFTQFLIGLCVVLL